MGPLQHILSSIRWDMISNTVSRLLAVLLCLTVHETCHGLAAYALGDPTAKRMHRLSFNPLHHIDWFGLAAMFLVGFGWAKPVPVDMRYFKKPKQGMALCALAGPVSNFVFAILALLPVRWMTYHAEATTATLWDLSIPGDAGASESGPGTFQSHPHPASGRLQSPVFYSAGSGILAADAV